MLADTVRNFRGHSQGRQHGLKVEGGQGLGPNTGALLPQGVACGRWSPSRCEGSGVSPPENF